MLNMCFKQSVECNASTVRTDPSVKAPKSQCTAGPSTAGESYKQVKVYHYSCLSQTNVKLGMYIYLFTTMNSKY